MPAYDDRGQATILVAMGLAVLLGALSLSVDVGRSLVTQFRLQNATDAAALAGAEALPNDPATAAAAAQRYAAANGAPQAQVTVANNGQAIAVQAGTTVPTLIARVLGVFGVPVAVVSHARPATYPTCWGDACNPSYEIPGGSGGNGPAGGGGTATTAGGADSAGSGGAHNPAVAVDTVGGQPTTCPQVLVHNAFTCAPPGSDQFGLAPLWVSTAEITRDFSSGGCFWTVAHCPDEELKAGGGGYSSNRGALSLDGPGAAAFRSDLAQGTQEAVHIGDSVRTQPGAMDGPTNQGLAQLCAADGGTPYVVVVVANPPGEGRQHITVAGFAVAQLDCSQNAPGWGDGSVWGHFVAAVLPGVVGPATEDSSADFGFYGRPSLTAS